MEDSSVGVIRVSVMRRDASRSGWSKSGLFPFNPNRVLNDLPQPQVEEIVQQTANMPTDPFSDVLRTPVTGESLASLRTKIEQVAALDTPNRYCFQKIANAAEKAFTDRTILLDENRLLFEQNNEKTTRQSARSTMVGNARIMTYDDIDHAERKRAAKEVIEPGAKRGSRRPQNFKPNGRERSRIDELEVGNREIEAFELEEYFPVLEF